MKKLIVLFCVLLFAFTVSAQKSPDTLFYKIKKATSRTNEVLLVLLHGYGANEDDLLGLAQFFPDNYTIVSPRAPLVSSADSYYWYEIKRINNRFDGKAEDLTKSRALIQQLILKMQKTCHVDKSHTIVAGFSQGAMLTYQMGLLYPELCKGIGVFSGTLFDSQKEAILKKHNSSLAIFIGHGDQDNRIPYVLAEESKQWLESHQFKTEFHNYKGAAHTIPQEEIRDFAQFVSNSIKK